MPHYVFKVEGEAATDRILLADDNEAWKQLVTFAGELMRDIDGRMPNDTDCEIAVREGTRRVGSVKFIARRGS